MVPWWGGSTSVQSTIRRHHEPTVVAASERATEGAGPVGGPAPISPPWRCSSLEVFLFGGVRCCYYLTILRATSPPATNSAPAPSANSDAAPLPPVFGSSFGAAAVGAGAGAGAGAGGGAAFGGGGGGGGSHGALATTPPAFASMTPSLHSASAFAPPALASLALASATTAGSSWARAGEAASMATASIAANIINFLNLPTSSC